MALPAVVQQFVSIIGHGPAMALVREFGGLDLRIPRAEGGDTWAALAEVIGEPETRRLVAAMGGVEVYVALCDHALKHDRNREMVAKYDKLLKLGHSSRGAVAVLVREFRPISNRQVEKIVNSPLPEPSGMARQPSLF